MLAFSSDPSQIFISIFTLLSTGVPLIPTLMLFPIIKIRNPVSFKTSNYVGYVFKLLQFQHPNRTIQKDLPLIYCKISV